MLGTWDFKKFFFSLQGMILVVIIALILITVFFAYINSGATANDQRRLSDINKIQEALKVSFGINGFYPDSSNNQPRGITSILDFWPTSPKANGGCTAAENTYTYAQRSNGSDYVLNFCLGSKQGNLPAGVHTATSKGIE